MTSTSPLIIGINGGATHTTFGLFDAALNQLATAESGPSNHHNIGREAATAALRQGIEALLQTASADQIGYVGAGMSGIDRADDIGLFQEMIWSILPAVKVHTQNDGMSALAAGVGRSYGVVVICGTGMISIGVNAEGEQTRSGGWGHFCDRGSGYEIARAALNAIYEAHDQTTPPTMLTQLVFQRLGLASHDELITWMYQSNRQIAEIAGLARECIQAAEAGDLIATQILVRAARELSRDVVSTIRKLKFDQQRSPVPVLMSGGVFEHSAIMRSQFTESLHALVPYAQPFLTERPATLGAAILALEAFGLPLPAFDFAPSEGQPVRATERRNPLTMQISTQADAFPFLMNLEDERVSAAVADQLPAIERLIAASAERYARGGRIFMVGAGTSGRLAVLDAAECLPTFNAGSDRIEGILAGGDWAMVHSVEGAEDDVEMGRDAMVTRQVSAADVVIGVAASGSTPFVIGALNEAKARGALTASVVNVMHAPISTLTEHPIVAATGAEVLTGSTRLKSGSAQKMILNMISTGVMIRVGRTYNNLMSHMLAANIKLQGRAVTIVAEATGLDCDAASALLARCGAIEVAIVAQKQGLDPDSARAWLAAHGDSISALF